MMTPASVASDTPKANAANNGISRPDTINGGKTHAQREAHVTL